MYFLCTLVKKAEYSSTYTRQKKKKTTTKIKTKQNKNKNKQTGAYRQQNVVPDLVPVLIWLQTV